jgi:hypothetical protein
VPPLRHPGKIEDICLANPMAALPMYGQVIIFCGIIHHRMKEQTAIPEGYGG